MRAYLLAAGRGERLGDITKETPKCLLPVGNKTMLEHWLYTFKQNGITDVIINLHYLASKVVKKYSDLLDYGIKVTFVYEPTLLGTGKFIYNNKDFVSNDRNFLIAYADTWMQPDLRGMLKFNKKRSGMGTIGLYKPTDMKDQGCIEVSGRKILSIEEKSAKPKSNSAFAGIMVGSHAMFKFYDSNTQDLVKDWLPKFKEGLNPYFMDGLVIDIGTPERYKEAQKKVGSLGLAAL